MQVLAPVSAWVAELAIQLALVLELKQEGVVVADSYHILRARSEVGLKQIDISFLLSLNY